MKIFLKRLPLFACAWLASFALNAADLTGVWQAEFDTQIGKQRYLFEFKADGAKLTGKTTGQIGDAAKRAPVEIQEGKIDGEEISFVEPFEFQGNALRITYTGKLAKDQIKFTRKVGDFATEEFTATPALVPLTAKASVSRRRAMQTPKAGPCPLPTLCALPEYRDTEFFAKKDVPHGKVEPVTYKTSGGQEKRMHIYTPPGYEQNTNARYPVLYLNHGGGDDDAKWTNTDPVNGGHAQFILDNLIATGKARAMLIVMPNTRGLASPNPPEPGQDDACTQGYLKDIIPYVDGHYRTKANRENRALAGLSMGGFVVMNTGLPHLDTFSELYVYSSGYFGEQQPAFEEKFAGLFKDPGTNDRFRVPFYMAAGETDIALLNGQRTLAVLNKNGIRNFWVLSSGGHDWANWRRYLYQTAQIMFP